MAKTTPMLVVEAVFPEDSAALKAIIREYVAWLDMDLSYRGFAQEMDSFDRLFTLPSGFFLMAKAGVEIAGCVGLLGHTPETAEVKRLYVRPDYRGRQLGEMLMKRLTEKAIGLGYQRLILDAVPQTRFAQRLYRSLGFEEIEPYYPKPVSGTRFFGMNLSSKASGELPGHPAG